MGTVAPDEILPTISPGRTVRTGHLQRHAIAILLEAHGLVSRKRFGQSRCFDCISEQAFCAVLWEDQNSGHGTESGKDAEVYFCDRLCLADDPEIDLLPEYTFRDKLLVNLPRAENLQSSGKDTERAGMRIDLGFGFEQC